MVKKKKETAEQRREKKQAQLFSKQIEQIFVFSGFTSLKVVGKTFSFGDFPIEFDHLFIYENVMVICEDTLSFYALKQEAEKANKPFKRNHKLEKKEAFDQLMKKKEAFFTELKSNFPNIKEFTAFVSNEFVIKYLYFDYKSNIVTAEEQTRYSPIVFVKHSTMLYFLNMANCIKKSFRYELFKYLGIPKVKIGLSTPGKRPLQLTTPIIYPRNVTGLNSGVRIVSFMMSPEDLIQNGYVLRKDSWEDENEDLYQRLISKKKVASVRKYIVENQQTFFNNIIVTLPNGVRFKENDGAGKEIKLEELTTYVNQVIMEVPTDFNSIAIIDGQHRVYGYYKDVVDNEQERIISQLRNKMNLLVTGIIYPEEPFWQEDINRRKFEGELFVSINKNAKPVDSDTLIRVQAIMDDTSPEAIARKVLERLNNQEPFKGRIQLSKLDGGQIKTASIIQYALASLVVAKNVKTSLYPYWLQKKNYSESYELKSEDVKDYAGFCANALISYFKAIRDKFRNEWEDKKSKILRIISINAFLIAYRETLEKMNGPQDFDYYKKIFSNYQFSFYDTEEVKFKYSGSRYKAFAEEEIIPLFIKDKEKRIIEDKQVD